MSGIEAVGLVLGLWPIVMNLVEAYKAGRGGSSVKALRMSIVVQEKIFKQSIQKLLQGDEKLSDKDKVGLVNGDDAFAAIWTQTEFINRLKKRLDDEMFEILNYKAEEIFKILKSLKKKIEKKDGESESLKALRLGLQNSEVKKNLAELKEHVSGLRTVLEASPNTTYVPQQKAALSPRPGHQRKTSGALRKKVFDDFHEALRSSFNCQCGRPHEASLRISDTLELVFPDDHASRTMSVGAGARPRSMTLGSQVSATLHTDVEEVENSSDIFRTTWSRSSPCSESSAASEHRAVSIIFNESHGVRNLIQISDLCQWVRGLRESPPSSPRNDYHGVLGPDGKRYTVAPRPHTGISPPTVMSMDDCLSSCDGAGLTRRVRLDLALNLASAIERFHPTSWIDMTWTWRNFSMIREDTAHRLCITKRFWSLEARRQTAVAAPASKFWRTLRHMDPMLIRLGFALIELAMGKRLSDLRAKMSGEDEPAEPESEWMKDLEDWNTANDLVEQNIIQDEVSLTYQQIVARCLKCEILEDTGVKLLRSGSQNFGDELDTFIVGPLRQYHADTWGVVSQMAAF
ncbi:uncharacterized protein BCR38DRAFT_353518 [Pseudomassariella vexata]|uniref:DUF7580 domain-containing protein n=1 Tax=Pseudomassariella vexata TaxID=1141098 RepID=A0A1Y2DFT4_9PEZI|nr:uncharacterized protein BCR38DRAFT_353518 [Pseudomassariella vexata]ORY58057.1 hypothetical protein BCR38DRAFT_353518 [Pseudomassariella vexata]